VSWLAMAELLDVKPTAAPLSSVTLAPTKFAAP
jgi:hypothetical protein